MPSVARRSPAPAPRTAVRPVARAAATATSSGYRGAEGIRRMQEEQERAEARKEANASMSGAPFRFYCPVGESREIVIVDDQPDFFRHEHNLKDGYGKWSIFTSCINEIANCPVCASNPDKSPYFAMYLTIIDLTPYVNSRNEEVPWSKKLLVVKSQQQKKIMRYLDRYGTLRGMVLQMTRDGDKDAAIGNDIEYVEHMSEDDLAAYVTTYTTKDNKVLDVIGNETFDYDEIFPAQTEEMLAAIVGGHVNNHESHNRNIGRGAPRRPAASSGDGWEEGQSTRAERGAARPAARPAPARRVVTREPEPEAEPEVADEVVEAEAPAPRTMRRPVPRQEAEYEDAPQRPAARPAPRQAPATSMADRRSALRGR